MFTRYSCWPHACPRVANQASRARNPTHADADAEVEVEAEAETEAEAEAVAEAGTTQRGLYLPVNAQSDTLRHKVAACFHPATN